MGTQEVPIKLMSLLHNVLTAPALCNLDFYCPTLLLYNIKTHITV